MPLQVFRKSIPATPPVVAPVRAKSTDSLVSKTVFFSGPDGARIAGQVLKRAEGAGYVVALAIPSSEGILQVTDSTVIVEPEKLEVFKGISEAANIKRFKSVSAFEDEDIKSVEVKDGNDVVDYRDVIIDGYASTFHGTTKADRDGDYVMDGAFTETIADFMKNPVMLIDHDNSVHQIAGSYTKVSQDKRGLAIKGKVSNRPGLRDVRFLLAEKHLKALSMGGIFYYAEDTKGIRKVTLFETSLVAVPANQDALFQVRSISIDDATKAYKYLVRNSALNFKKL